MRDERHGRPGRLVHLRRRRLEHAIAPIALLAALAAAQAPDSGAWDAAFDEVRAALDLRGVRLAVGDAVTVTDGHAVVEVAHADGHAARVERLYVAVAALRRPSATLPPLAVPPPDPAPRPRPTVAAPTRVVVERPPAPTAVQLPDPAPVVVVSLVSPPPGAVVIPERHPSWHVRASLLAVGTSQAAAGTSLRVEARRGPLGVGGRVGAGWDPDVRRADRPTLLTAPVSATWVDLAATGSARLGPPVWVVGGLGASHRWYTALGEPLGAGWFPAVELGAAAEVGTRALAFRPELSVGVDLRRAELSRASRREPLRAVHALLGLGVSVGR